ncbi:hypothetical protein WG66_002223 [Moniliophthora roreri]|nr:hypothetical protein WG66_002223 [Moniliophthora roreri]
MSRQHITGRNCYIQPYHVEDEHCDRHGPGRLIRSQSPEGSSMALVLEQTLLNLYLPQSSLVPFRLLPSFYTYPYLTVRRCTQAIYPTNPDAVL